MNEDDITHDVFLTMTMCYNVHAFVVSFCRMKQVWYNGSENSVAIRGGTSYEKLGGRKISGPKIFCNCPPTIPVCPPRHLLGAHVFFAPSLGHACCDHNESESYRTTIIICRHCVEQQTYSLVFTEFQSEHREWRHWKVGGQTPILVPLHRNLEGHSPSLPYSLFHPWRWYIASRDLTSLYSTKSVSLYSLLCFSLDFLIRNHAAILRIFRRRFLAAVQRTLRCTRLIRPQCHVSLVFLSHGL